MKQQCSIATTLIGTRIELCETRKKALKQKSETLELELFQLFSRCKNQLSDLKSLLDNTNPKHKFFDSGVVQILRCFDDDPFFGSNGYEYINVQTGDNRCELSQELRDIQIYEQTHQEKVLQRDYESYLNKTPEKSLLKHFTPSQFEYVIQWLWSGYVFDVQDVLILGADLSDYLSIYHNQNKYDQRTSEQSITATVMKSDLVAKLPFSQKGVIRRRLDQFLQHPSEQYIIDIMRAVVCPRWIDIARQKIIERRNSIVTLGVVGLLAIVTKEIVDMFISPYLAEQTVYLTHYRDKVDAEDKLCEYNEKRRVLYENDELKYHPMTFRPEEMHALVTLEEMKENWKNNTRLLFQGMFSRGDEKLYFGSDFHLYRFTQEDIDQSISIIDSMDMRILERCLGSRSTEYVGNDPYYRIKPLLMNISFFPLGDELAGVHYHKSPRNQVVLLNTRFIAPADQVDYDFLAEVLLHEIGHGVVGDRGIVTVTEGRTDRLTDWYFYENAGVDNFSISDAYAHFKLGDYLGRKVLLHFASFHEANPIQMRYRDAFANHTIRDDYEYGDEDIDKQIEKELAWYDTLPGDARIYGFRSIKTTKLADFLHQYHDRIIHPELFLLVYTDPSSYHGNNLLNVIEDETDRFFDHQDSTVLEESVVTPKTLEAVDNLLSSFKSKEIYKKFLSIDNPRERTVEFDKIKKSYLIKKFAPKRNTPLQPKKKSEDESGSSGSINRQGALSVAGIMTLGLSVLILYILIINKLNQKRQSNFAKLATDLDILLYEQKHIEGDPISTLRAVSYLINAFAVSFLLLGVTNSNYLYLGGVLLAWILQGITIYQTKNLLQIKYNDLVKQNSVDHYHHFYKVRTIQDLCNENREILLGYKTKFYELLNEGPVYNMLNPNVTLYKDIVNHLNKDKSQIISTIIHTPISGSFTELMDAVFQPRLHKKLCHQFVDGEQKLIGPGDTVHGRINWMNSAKYPNKLAVIPQEYRHVKQLKRNGRLLVGVCLDHSFPADDIEDLKSFKGKWKNMFKKGSTTIPDILQSNQMKKLHEVFNIFLYLLNTKNSLSKDIQVLCTLNGKVVDLIDMNQIRVTDLKGIIEKIFGWYFEPFVMRNSTEFRDDRFIRDFFLEKVPGECISLGYTSDREEMSFAKCIKQQANQLKKNILVHEIDEDGNITLDYHINRPT